MRRPPDLNRVETPLDRGPKASTHRSTTAVPAPVGADEDICHVHRRWWNNAAAHQPSNKFGQTVLRSSARTPSVARKSPLSPIEHDNLALRPFGPSCDSLEPQRSPLFELAGGDLKEASEERICQNVARPRKRVLDHYEDVELRCRTHRFDAEVASPRRAARVRQLVLHGAASAEVPVSTNTSPPSTLRAYCSSWQPGFEMPFPVMASKDHMWLAQVMTVPSKPPKARENCSWGQIPSMARNVPEASRSKSTSQSSTKNAVISPAPISLSWQTRSKAIANSVLSLPEESTGSNGGPGPGNRRTGPATAH